MTDELDRIWKEEVMIQSNYNLGICFDGQQKIMKTPQKGYPVPQQRFEPKISIIKD
jgi:hypothetical protein